MRCIIQCIKKDYPCAMRRRANFINIEDIQLNPIYLI